MTSSSGLGLLFVWTDGVSVWSSRNYTTLVLTPFSSLLWCCQLFHFSKALANVAWLHSNMFPELFWRIVQQWHGSYFWCILILSLLGEADHSFLGNLVLNFLFFFLNGVLLDITSTLTTPVLFCVIEKDKCEKEKYLYFTLPHRLWTFPHHIVITTLGLVRASSTFLVCFDADLRSDSHQGGRVSRF